MMLDLFKLGAICALTLSSVLMASGNVSLSERELVRAECEAAHGERLRAVIDWSTVNTSGFSGLLIRDAQFLALPFNFTPAAASALSVGDFKRILDIPLISDNLSAFLRQVLFTRGGLTIKLDPDLDEKFREITIRLAAKADEETFTNVILRLLQKYESKRILLTKVFNAYRVTPEHEEMIEGIVRSRTITLVKLTSKRIPPPDSLQTLEGFYTYEAGRYAFQYLTGNKTAVLVIDAQGELSFREPVSPGLTAFSGAVFPAVGKDMWKTKTAFSQGDIKKLFLALLARYGTPESTLGSDRSLFINILAAVYARGERSRLELH